MYKKIECFIKKWFWLIFLANTFTQTLLLLVVPAMVMNATGWIMMFGMSLVYQLILVIMFRPNKRCGMVTEDEEDDDDDTNG